MRPEAGPLAGVRVLELGSLGPVPFCGMLLAQLGADVVRVDRPGGMPSPLASLTDFGLTDPLASGRRSVEADLKTHEGTQLVLALAGRADILIEGWRPGVAERLGVGPEQCLQANDALVYGRMTGWGQDGPLAQRAGHDINYLALSGALSTLGPADGAPMVPLNLVGDFGGGALYLAVGVLAALRRAAVSGHGEVVDAAIVDGVSHLTTMMHGLAHAGFWNDSRGTNVLDGSLPYYTVYETSDGKFMAVGALEDRFFAQLCDTLGTEAPADREDPGCHPYLRSQLSAAFRSRTQAEWEAEFQGRDACVTPVRTLAEARQDHHLVARGVFGSSGPNDSLPAAAPRFSAAGSRQLGAPPMPGEHTDEVVSHWGACAPLSPDHDGPETADGGSR